MRRAITDTPEFRAGIRDPVSAQYRRWPSPWAEPVFRQVARARVPQTAALQQVGTGPHAADLTFPAACSPARSGRFPFAGSAFAYVAVRLLAFT